MESLNTIVFQFFNGFAGQSDWLDQTIVFFADYLAYILVAVFLIILIYRKNETVQKLKLGLSAATSFVLSEAVVQGIRFFYHHPRPFAALGDVHQLFPEFGYSFPSAHAAFFFALSTFIYQENKIFGIIFFISSFLMGIARIAAGVHYPFDILGGAVFGIIAGLCATSLAKACFAKRQSGQNQL